MMIQCEILERLIKQKEEIEKKLVANTADRELDHAKVS